MKTASTTLKTFLAAARANADMQIAFAECFTFTLATGTVLTYTNADVPISYQGKLFLANGPLISGLKYRSSVGLNVDRQDVIIAARPGDLMAGSPFLVALRDGAFDGAQVRRDRVFFSDVIGGTLVDGVTMFLGRVSTVDEVGRTKAKISVASELVLLDIDMPRNIFAPTCLHVLYDVGCGIPASGFAVNDVVVSGSTTMLVNFASAAANQAQGSLVFTSGVNAGLRVTMKTITPGVSASLIYPLPSAPSAGDGITAYWGCDHTMGTCNAKFANLANFRGFPFVPPPQTAI